MLRTIRFGCLNLLILIISSGASVGQSGRHGRTLIDKIEDISRRSTNTRVWVNTYQVPDTDASGRATGDVRTVTSELIVKADHLFFEDPSTGALRETKSEWIQQGSRFETIDRKARIESRIDSREEKLIIEHFLDSERRFSFVMGDIGVFDPSQDRFFSAGGLNFTDIERPNPGRLTVRGASENLSVNLNLSLSKLHVDLVLMDADAAPNPVDFGVNPQTAYVAITYDIFSTGAPIRGYRRGLALAQGETVEIGYGILGIGWEGDRHPSFHLGASLAYCANFRGHDTPTLKRVTYHGDRISVVEGIPKRWLDHPRTSYPVILDPPIILNSTESARGETFQGGKTYFLEDDFTIMNAQTEEQIRDPADHVVIEPGAVIKINGGDGEVDPSKLIVFGTLSVLGEPYNPVVITSADDDSVGEIIPSDERHSGYFDFIGISSDLNSPNPSRFNYLKITRANTGIRLFGFTTPDQFNPRNATIRDCIFGEMRYFAASLHTKDTYKKEKPGHAEIFFINNLFSKDEEDSGDRIHDINIAPDGNKCTATFLNNTFASENADSLTTYKTSAIEVDFGLGDSEFQPENAEVSIRLENNIFVRTQANMSFIRFLKDDEKPVLSTVTLNRKKNIFVSLGAASIQYDEVKVAEGLSLVEHSSEDDLDRFDETIFESRATGHYYIADSALEECTDAGSYDAAYVGLDGKTIQAPSQDPASVTSPWGRVALRDQGLADVGFHYDPVDYILEGDVEIEVDLTIQPGVVIAAHPDDEETMGGLSVTGNGSLRAEGIPGEPILWVPSSSIGVVESPPSAGDWKGISISSNDDEAKNILRYNLIHGAEVGVDLSNPEGIALLEGNSITLVGSGNENGGIGIKVLGPATEDVIIRSNRIVLDPSAQAGIHLEATDAFVYNNTIVTTQPIGSSQATGVSIDTSSSQPCEPVLAYNLISSCAVGIEVQSDSAIDPHFADNLVYDWKVASENFNGNTNNGSNDWNPIVDRNPQFVSSREIGYDGWAEDYYLPQHEGDASRVPWRIDRLQEIETTGIESLPVADSPHSGRIEVWTTTPERESYLKGYIEPDASPTLETDTTEGDVLVVFVGPLRIESNASLTLTRANGCKVSIAIPRRWKYNDDSNNDGVCADPEDGAIDGEGDPVYEKDVCFWVATDGSLYYAQAEHPTALSCAWPANTIFRPTTAIGAPPIDVTARFAMRYVTEFDAPLGTEDLDSEKGNPNDIHYSGALASSSYDEKILSGAKDVLRPNGSPFFDYAGTAARFSRRDDGSSLTPAHDFGYLDLGAHGFRGRHWVTDKSKIQLSWDRPFQYEGTIDGYAVEIIPNSLEAIPLGNFVEDAILNLDVHDIDQLPPDQPHVIEIAAIAADEEKGSPAQVPFGYDSTPPTLSVVGAGPRVDSKFYFYDHAEDRFFYNGNQISPLPSSTPLWLRLRDNASGPWKFVFEPGSTSRALHYPADLFAPTRFMIDVATSSNHSIIGYDAAGLPSNTFSGFDTIDDSAAPTLGDIVLDPNTTSVSGVVTIEFDDPVEDQGSGMDPASGIREVEYYLISGSQETLIGVVKSSPYHLVWNSAPHAPMNSVTLKARCYDNVSNYTDKSLAEVEIQAAPTPTPPEDCEVTPDELKCDFLVEPLGIDSTEPRLSWINVPILDAQRGQQQTAYRIWIAETNDDLDDDPPFWGSGDSMDDYWVESSDQCHVLSDGPEWESGKRYWWKVAVKDAFGNESDWSESTHFTMGLLDGFSENSEWIGVQSTQPGATKETAPAGFLSEPLDPSLNDSGEPFTLILKLPIGEDPDLKIDEIRLIPAWNPDKYDVFEQPESDIGYYFPLRLSVETNSEVQRSEKRQKNRVLVDETVTSSILASEQSSGASGFGVLQTPIRGFLGAVNHPLVFRPKEKAQKYIMFRMHGLWNQDHPGSDEPERAFAFAEIEVLSDGVNLARNATIFYEGNSGYQVEGETIGELWKPEYLTDGIQRSGAAPAVYLRRDIPADAFPEDFFENDENRVLVFVSSLGSHELRVDGEPINNLEPNAGRTVGKNHLGQVWTLYNTNRVGCQTHDITDLVNDGQPHALGIVLGEGYYTGPAWVFGSYLYDGAQPAVKMEVWAVYASSATEDEDDLIAKTDHAVTGDRNLKWQATTRTHLAASGIANGEKFVEDVYYGDGYSLDGWDGLDYFKEDPETGPDPFTFWEDVAVLEPDVGQTEAQLIEKIEIVRELVMNDEDNYKGGTPSRRVYDVGETVSGWVRLKLTLSDEGSDKREIRVRHADSLIPEYPEPTLHTHNLGSAQQTDTYLVGKNQEIDLEPVLTTHGFRYFEIGGLDSSDVIQELTVVVAHANVPKVGHFICSNPAVNALHDLVERSFVGDQQGHMLGSPSVSEVVGWMDYGNTFKAAAYLRDVARFYSKAMQDIVDSQDDAGRYCDFAPMFPEHLSAVNFRRQIHYNSPGWGDLALNIPLEFHEMYGDSSLISKHIESMKDFVDSIEHNQQSPDRLWSSEIWDFETGSGHGASYGDWQNGDTHRGLWDWYSIGASLPIDIFATAHYAKAAQNLSRMAAIVGETADAKYYAGLTRQIKAKFMNEFLDEGMDYKAVKDGRGHTQSFYALALDFDLLIKLDEGDPVDEGGDPFTSPSESTGVPDEDLRRVAMDHLIERLAQTGYRINTGFRATPSLMRALVENGSPEVAYKLLLNRGAPSWLYMVDKGADTIWESWDSFVPGRDTGTLGPTYDDRLNLFHGFGTIGEWLYRHIGGINPDPNPENAGFKHFIVRPRLGGDLTCADVSYDSVRGTIRSHWWIKPQEFGENELHFEVTIPPNTTATVYLPGEDVSKVWAKVEGGADIPAAAAEGVENTYPDVSAGDAIVFELGSGMYRFYSISDRLFPKACVGCPCGGEE